MASGRARQRIGIRKHRPDYGLVLITGILLIIGLIVIYSIGPALQSSAGITTPKQFFAIGVGIAAFIATATIPLTFWRKVQGMLVGAAITTSAMLYLLPGEVFNPDINGAKRWLVLGPFSFQPSELIKFALMIYLASFLAKHVKHKTISDANETIIPVGVILGVLGFIIVLLQRDLGTMLVIAAITISMLYIAGARMKHLAYIGGGMVASGIVAVIVAPHRISRFLTFLDPSSDINGAGYHINQALIGVGSGGLFGLGLGRSVQAYGYLPEAANDSVFAIYAEKFGFVGTVVILTLFGVLLLRITKIIERAPNTYTRLMAVGIFAWIFSHIVINIGAMLGLLPLTGITLPFLSYGGSSLLFIMASLGLLFNISRYTVHEPINQKQGGANAYSSNRRRHRRTRHAT